MPGNFKLQPPHWAMGGLTALLALVASTHVDGNVVTLSFTVPAAAATAIGAIITVIGFLSASAKHTTNVAAVAAQTNQGDSKTIQGTKVIT